MTPFTKSPSRRERRAQAVHERRRARRLEQDLASPLSLADAAASSLCGPQTISLSMIVRDENGPHLWRCIDSARPFITHWAVVDTGSVDGTQDAIREYLRDLPGKIVEREWVDDFAHSRNQAFELGRASGAAFALVIDADDYIAQRGVECPALPRLTADVTSFESFETGRRFGQRPTFVSLLAPIRWRGRVHEYLARNDGRHVSLLVDPAYTTQVTRDGAASKDAEAKRQRYLRALLECVTLDPGDTHSWECLRAHWTEEGDYPEARRCADHAVRSVPPENRHWRYRVGLNRVFTLPVQDGIAALEDLMRLCPERAEAPRVLARTLRGLGRTELAARLDAIADTKTIPQGAYGVDYECYRRGFELAFARDARASP